MPLMLNREAASPLHWEMLVFHSPPTSPTNDPRRSLHRETSVISHPSTPSDVELDSRSPAASVGKQGPVYLCPSQCHEDRIVRRSRSSFIGCRSDHVNSTVETDYFSSRSPKRLSHLPDSHAGRSTTTFGQDCLDVHTPGTESSSSWDSSGPITPPINSVEARRSRSAYTWWNGKDEMNLDAVRTGIDGREDTPKSSFSDSDSDCNDESDAESDIGGVEVFSRAASPTSGGVVICAIARSPVLESRAMQTSSARRIDAAVMRERLALRRSADREAVQQREEAVAIAVAAAPPFQWPEVDIDAFEPELPTRIRARDGPRRCPSMPCASSWEGGVPTITTPLSSSERAYRLGGGCMLDRDHRHPPPPPALGPLPIELRTPWESAPDPMTPTTRRRSRTASGLLNSTRRAMASQLLAPWRS